MAKRRCRSSEAPGRPFVYQPKCFRNSRAVFRVSACSRSARRACSSAVLKRSAGDTRKTALEFRKHFGWYTKGLPGASELRQRLFAIESMAEAEAIFADYLAR